MSRGIADMLSAPSTLDSDAVAVAAGTAVGIHKGISRSMVDVAKQRPHMLVTLFQALHNCLIKVVSS